MILPHRIYKSMRNMSDAECGRLFRALLLHSMGEDQRIKLQGREIGLFDVYSQDIDDDIAAYDAKCARNKTIRSQSSPVVTSGDQSSPVVTSRHQSSPVVTSGDQSPHNNNNNIQEQEHSGDTRASARFTPPGLEAVEAYARERGWGPDVFSPERFVDFYGSKGWHVGKDPMRDWKAAARGWVSRQRQEASGGSPQREKDNPALNYEQREYRAEDFDEGFFVDLDKYGGEA